ncbi:MAG TPA: hypothetical protein VKZ72_01875 [Acidimicrobiales bacterium]|nr:hypothetical protein [Acidimicrobiales bacterium]
MAVAFTPDAFLNRTTDTAWDVYYSWCGSRRIDTDREQYTVLAYLGNAFVGNGIQFTADPDRKLVVFECRNFNDLLEGDGPTIPVGQWWFFGVTTIPEDEPDNMVLYWAAYGDEALSSATVTYEGEYGYSWHGVGGRPGTDGADGAYRLYGSAAHDRSWQNTTLTPAEMLAEFQSPTAVKAGAWAIWDMASAETATDDSSGNDRDLTAFTGTGSITTTDGPFDSSTGTDGTAEPTAIAVAATLPHAALAAGATPSPATIPAAAGIPTPTPAAGSTVALESAAATVTLPGPETAAGGTASPLTVATAAAIPAPTVAAGSTVAAEAIAAAVTAPAVTLAAGATAGPGAITAPTALPAPTVIAGGSATVAPGPIAAAVTVLAAAVSAGAGPSTLFATTGLPAPTATGTGAGAATPAAINLPVLMPKAAVTGVVSAPDIAVAGTWRESAARTFRERIARLWREP